MTAVRIFVYLATCVVFWLAARPYEGITLDGQLYALQVLATLQPYPLAEDIFLRYGSQNDFTLFPHLVAPLVKAFGLEPAAALVTIASALALLAAGWLLARDISSWRLALLGLGLLIAIPGSYGAAEVFRFDEMYLTARVPAEALAAFALVLACRLRWWAAGLAALAAVTMHPVMALPAVGVVILLVLDHHSGYLLDDRTATTVALGGALLVSAAAAILAPERTPEHLQWVATLRERTVYAFLQEWGTGDWIQNALGLSTLAIAAAVLPSRIGRRLAWFSLIVGVIGLALGALGSLVDQFDLLLLVQSWRWPWVGRFVAVVLLPAIVVALWREGSIGRASSIILACAWVLAAYSGGLIALGAAVLWFSRRHLGEDIHSRVLAGAYLLVAATAVVMTSVSLQVLTLEFDTGRAPLWVQRFTDLAGVTGPPAVVIAIAWYFTLAKRSALGISTVGVLAAIALWGQLPFAYARLTAERYSAEAQASFAQWRDIVPPSAEVFWHEEPAAVWALLGRKSFLSVSQSAGLMYSADAIPEFRRRSETLSSMVTTDWWTRGRVHDDDVFPTTLSMPILHEICRDRTLGFVVSGAQLKGYASRAEWPIRGQNVYLYDCAAFRDEPQS